MPRQILLRDRGGADALYVECAAGNETELHALVKDHPELLPAEEMELAGPLLVVGKETPVASGRIDLVCLSKNGDLALVEFKTGPENPDFRQVLAQLADYGAQLWRKSLEQFEDSVVRQYLRISLAEAMNSLEYEDDDEAEGARRQLAKQLAQGRFTYVAAAQKFTEAMLTTIDYLNATMASDFYALEIVRFDGSGGSAYESRIVARPPRVRTLGSRPGALIDKDAFLEEIDDESYRTAMESLIESLPALGIRANFVSEGFSLRVKTQLRPEPLTIGWGFPPTAIYGYKGAKDLTLGFERRFLSLFPAAVPAFEEYRRGLSAIPDGETVSGDSLVAFHFSPNVITQAFVDSLKPILAQAQQDLTALVAP